MNRKVFFWQNTPSIHQAPLIRELSARWFPTISVICDEPLRSSRKSLGWTVPDMGGAEVRVAPTVNERRAIEQTSSPEDIHIFSGLGAYPGVTSSFGRLARSGASTVIFSEPWDDRGVKGLLREIKYRLAIRRWLRDIDLVLCVGDQAHRQFLSAGIAQEKLAYFAYFTDLPVLESKERTRAEVSLVYVGSLIERKNVEVLLRALSTHTASSWRLYVVGDGELRVPLELLGQQLGLSTRVNWLGAVPNSNVTELIGQSDYLILPSQFDGWGAVVNEALLSGTRVIVSRNCGSSQVVTSANRGYTFQTQRDLTEVLQAVLAAGPLNKKQRRLVKEDAISSLSPSVGADYLVSLLTNSRVSGVPPRVPWLA